MVQAQYLNFPDSGDIHGALLALSELAIAFGMESANGDMAAARRKVTKLRPNSHNAYSKGVGLLFSSESAHEHGSLA